MRLENILFKAAFLLTFNWAGSIFKLASRGWEAGKEVGG